MGNENSIIEVQMDLTQIVKECYNKVEGILKKYATSAGDIPYPPEYGVLMRGGGAEYYKWYNEYLRIGDDIVCSMVAIRLVINSIEEMKNLVPKSSKDVFKDYSVAQGFRTFIDKNLEKLHGYRYDLVALQRQVTDRIKLLQNISFQQ